MSDAKDDRALYDDLNMQIAVMRRRFRRARRLALPRCDGGPHLGNSRRQDGGVFKPIPHSSSKSAGSAFRYDHLCFLFPLVLLDLARQQLPCDELFARCVASPAAKARIINKWRMRRGR